MKYKCLKCGKEFKQKGHYDAHNNKKFPCNNKIDDNNNELLINHNESLLNHNESLMNHNESLVNLSESSNNNSNNTEFKCLHCSFIFKQKTNLTRHLKLYCKKKTETTNINMVIDELQKIKEDNNKIKEENNILKEKLNKIEQLNNLAVVSKPKNSNSKTKNNLNNSQNTSNTSNNSNNTSNNTSNIGTINNFIINKTHITKTSNFGEEDLTLIPDIDKLIALKGKKEAFFNYFSLVNLNENFPQNQNLLYKNIRSNVGSIVENNVLVAKSVREILELVVNTRLPEIEELMDKFSEKNLLTPIEIHTLKETINFLKNAYLVGAFGSTLKSFAFRETEDVDGNIVKANKDMARKLKDFYEKLKLMIYNNNEMVNKNITKFLIDPLFDPLLEPINQLIKD
jgi:hypothetical protein